MYHQYGGHWGIDRESFQVRFSGRIEVGNPFECLFTLGDFEQKPSSLKWFCCGLSNESVHYPPSRGTWYCLGWLHPCSTDYVTTALLVGNFRPLFWTYILFFLSYWTAPRPTVTRVLLRRGVVHVHVHFSLCCNYSPSPRIIYFTTLPPVRENALHIVLKHGLWQKRTASPATTAHTKKRSQACYLETDQVHSWTVYQLWSASETQAKLKVYAEHDDQCSHRTEYTIQSCSFLEWTDLVKTILYSYISHKFVDISYLSKDHIIVT